MAISDYILGPRFIDGGISTLNLPANISPFFRMNATSGATIEPYENFYQKFNVPLQQMDYNSVTLGDGQYLLQPDNSPRFLLQPNTNTNVPMRPPLDMNRFQGVSDMSIIDETTDDEQDQEYIDQVNQSNNKFGGIMDLIGSLVIPGYGFFKGIAKGGLEGLKGFGRKIGQSDFAQSRTGAEFAMKRRERKQAERAQETMPDVYRSAKEQGFTNDRGGFSTSRADRAGTSLGSGQFSSKRSTGRQGY